MIIIAAIGLNSFSEDKVRKIVLAGADVLRYNFSYRTIEQNINYIKTAQDVICDVNASVKILADFPINKIRLGDFDIKQFAVREDEEFIFQSASFSPDCNQYIPVNAQNLGEKMKIGQAVTIGDGEVAIIITEILDKDKIKARVLNNGIISYVKSFNTGATISEAEILKIYSDILIQLKEVGVEMIAISNLGKTTNRKIKELIESHKIYAKKIIKIEGKIDPATFEEICTDKFYDYVMLDRGEMGVNSSYEKMGVAQKKLMALAKKHKKPIFVASQILESTINNLIPNRSEINDLTNIVLDGASGIMLCHVTAVGKRPVYSIATAKKIIAEAKHYQQSLNTK